MLNKIALVILFVLTSICYYLSFNQGDNFEIINYQIFSNWYLVSFLGRIIPGLFIFSFFQLLFNHQNKFFRFIFLVSICFFILISIKLNLNDTIIPNSMIKSYLHLIIPCYTVFSILIFLLREKKKDDSKKWIITTLTTTTTISLTFITTPLFFNDYQQPIQKTENQKAKMISGAENKNLIIYASTSCPYCYKALLKTHLTLRNNLSTKNKILVKFTEDNERIIAFFEFINLKFEFEKISKETFIEENGYKYPSFLLINNHQKIIDNWEAEDFNYFTLENLNKTISSIK
jgi:hypothetical protein